MEMIDYHPRPDQLVHTFGGSAPAMSVRPGTALRLWSEDAFNNALTSVDDVSGEKVDLDFVNPQTGPFYVEGAQPGDTLALHIADLTPARSYGVSATVPFFGGPAGTGRAATLQEPLPDITWIYHVDTERRTVGFRSRRGDFEVALPLEPMLGTIGVAPPGGAVRSSLVPERFGGNMDAPEVRAGTTVYLGVNVEGALFSIGDGHYRQGAGEACGTAVEGAMHSTIIVELIHGGAPAWPRLETDYHWMAVGSSRPLGDSWRIGQVEMVRWFGDLFGLHQLDAYQLLTQTALAPIANAVGDNYSVVVKAPKALFPSADAYGGLHAHLRREAETLR